VCVCVCVCVCFKLHFGSVRILDQRNTPLRAGQKLTPNCSGHLRSPGEDSLSLSLSLVHFLSPSLTLFILLPLYISLFLSLSHLLSVSPSHIIYFTHSIYLSFYLSFTSSLRFSFLVNLNFYFSPCLHANTFSSIAPFFHSFFSLSSHPHLALVLFSISLLLSLPIALYFFLSFFFSTLNLLSLFLFSQLLIH
jgi:hypothetical protein